MGSLSHPSETMKRYRSRDSLVIIKFYSYGIKKDPVAKNCMHMYLLSSNGDLGKAAR
jgi:hypothetical protein